VQEEVSTESKPWAHKPPAFQRLEQAAPKPEAAKQAVKLGGDLWRYRQLRDYRRANNMCLRCGEKYDPTHQCAKKLGAEVHAVELDEQTELLSEEVLNLMELHGIAQTEQLSLSIHTMAGTEGAETMKLRASVGNQVFLI
jgi:hypothetical protein